MTTPLLWTAQALQAATGGTLSVPFDAHGVSIDTRTLQPGDLFVALVGENGDGHVHVAAAMARGAAGALVHREMPGVGPILRVDNTLHGLTALGAAGRARFGGRCVAVTGSVGKTTTKEMLRAALQPFGPRPRSAGILQQPLGRAADPGTPARRRRLLRGGDRHEPCR